MNGFPVKGSSNYLERKRKCLSQGRNHKDCYFLECGIRGKKKIQPHLESDVHTGPNEVIT